MRVKVPTSQQLNEETERGKAPYPVFIGEDNCPNLSHLIRVASCADPSVPTTMYVRSSVWGIIAGELAGLPSEIFTDPANMPNPSNFKALQLTNNFKIVNAGTDSQLLVDLKNVTEAEAAKTKSRAQKLGFREEKAVDPRNVAKDH